MLLISNAVYVNFMNISAQKKMESHSSSKHFEHENLKIEIIKVLWNPPLIW